MACVGEVILVLQYLLLGNAHPISLRNFVAIGKIGNLSMRVFDARLAFYVKYANLGRVTIEQQGVGGNVKDLENLLASKEFIRMDSFMKLSRIGRSSISWEKMSCRLISSHLIGSMYCG